MPQTQREDIVADQVSHIFRTHGDARVHSSARWLMTKWGGKFEELAREIEQVELRRELPEPGKNWHVDLSGCTFAVFEPDEFEMGSGGELPHRRRIPRRFGICIQETTVGEFVMFVNALRVRAENRLEALANSSDERPIRVQEVEIKKLNRKLEEMAKLDIRRPITDVDFFKALAYCRWLSDKQNLRSSLPKIDQLEQFYEKGDGMAYSWVHLDRPGYRLPTAGEWEFACRARTDTLRPFGLIDRRLNQNAWFVSNSENSTQPVALLKPNVAGLFDMLGNVNEWCLDFYHSDLAPEWELSGESEPLVDFADQRQSPAREYRGGSYSSELNELQTAHRTGTNARKGFRHLGFRIARTYPPAD